MSHQKTKSPWFHLLPPVAVLIIIIYFSFHSNNHVHSKASIGQRLVAYFSQPATNKKREKLTPVAAQIRDPFSRETILKEARGALEAWWYMNEENNKADAVQLCPYSTLGPPELPKDAEEKKVFYETVKRGIDVMEAMGFSNITTCDGRYPRLTKEIPKVGSNDDKIQHLLAGLTTSTNHSEESIKTRFCYTPTFRPPIKISPDFETNVHQNDRANNNVQDNNFCNKLIELYHKISSGREPPLITIFVWIPDPIQDTEKISRRFLALNLNMFKPFVQPVLVSDRRMVMAIANTINWPCLPITEFSPDGVPLFQLLARSVHARFNSTFYGYAKGTSLFDASLLETLLSVKSKFLLNKKGMDIDYSSKPLEGNLQSTKSVFISGVSFYKKDVSFKSDLREVGWIAKKQGSRDWEDDDMSAFTYMVYTKNNFSDIPALKIDDKYLVPLLAQRAKLMDHVVIDTSNTLLSIFNVHDKIVNEWNRILLPSQSRDEYFNKIQSQKYFEILKSRAMKSSTRGHIYSTRFDMDGTITYDNV